MPSRRGKKGSALRIIVGAWVLSTGVATIAQAGDADWKAYAFVQNADGDLVCFYDANGISSAGMRTRVWVKCLLQKELESFSKEHRVEILANVSRKVTAGYVPPFVTVSGMNSQRVTAITAAEEVANMGEVVQTRGRFFYELDCAERMQRRLSAYGFINNKPVLDNSPGEWSRLPPESAGAILAKVVCPVR
jgi:hypothetical protein